MLIPLLTLLENLTLPWYSLVDKAFMSSSLNGSLAQVIAYNTTPILHTSAFLPSYGSPRRIWGQQYAKEPQ